MPEELLLIGDFAVRCGVSAKALRRYHDLGLLEPVRVDAASGYRWYSPAQVPVARQVALLRYLDMPLARIAEVLALPSTDAARAVGQFWSEQNQLFSARAAAAGYLCALLTKGDGSMTHDYDVTIHDIPERALLTAVRYVHTDQAATLLGALLRRMSQAGPGVTGLAGCPFSIHHGAVTADSDGPVEIVRPMAGLPLAQQAAALLGDVQARTEAAHQEAGVRLTMAQLAWPAQLPALDALEGYLRDLGRTPAGPPRQIMIADWRTAAPDTIGAVLALPLTA